jgi:protein-tyrosine phosphatase
MSDYRNSTDEDFHHGVCWVTSRIAFGRFATPERALFLRSKCITHVINVSDATSVIDSQEFGFDKVMDIPIVDLTRIPVDIAIRCCDSINAVLRGMAHQKVFVHCTAGQNRSPTVVWLYLVACGIEPDTAKRMIVSKSPDAVPGHSSLVDCELIVSVKAHAMKKGFYTCDSGISEA